METVEHQIVTLSGDEARKENQRSKFGAKLDRCKKMIDPDLDPASQSYTICIVAILGCASRRSEEAGSHG